MIPHILLVDDDAELTELLRQYLEHEGFEVLCAYDGDQGVKKALNHRVDAIILDVMLPKRNGFEVLRMIREHQDTPVLMLTARGDDVDRIVGLEIGADDYMPKPCNPRELIARLRAILRRSQKVVPVRPQIEFHGLTIDTGKRKVSVHGKSLELTNAEYNILEILAKTPGQAWSKEELTEHALGRHFTAFDRSIDVHISNLRTKLGEHGEGSPGIRTVRGFGYMLDA